MSQLEFFLVCSLELHQCRWISSWPLPPEWGSFCKHLSPVKWVRCLTALGVMLQ